MSAGFALLWSKILDSSIWLESKEARLVWITMLAMKDSEGRVIAAPGMLAHRARVEEEACEEALRVFMEPDAQSGSKVEDGRRIRVIEGGWQIINHEQYRFSTEAKREFWKEQKRQQREAMKKPQPPVRGRQLAGESAYLKAERAGASEEKLAAIAAAGLPTKGKTLKEGLSTKKGVPSTQEASYPSGVASKTAPSRLTAVRADLTRACYTPAELDMMARAEAAGDTVTLNLLEARSKERQTLPDPATSL
jgi:hypothetical protein